jgi:diguanylate cyclase (GGDEF)-like protein
MDAELFTSLLTRAFPAGFTVEVRQGLKTALERVRAEEFDCVCVDLRLPDATGTQCVEELIGEAPGLPIVVLTGDDNEELALESVRAGAEDYLVKGNVSGSQIGHALRYACERKRNQVELTTAAQRDSLTGLSNRRHFEDRLARALSLPTGRDGVSIVLVDLDNFKPVNDTYGHAAGDALLVELARRMAAAVRDTDVCARLGGDEFAILVTQVHSAEEVEEIAERVRKTICSPVMVNDMILTPAASIGIATGSVHNDTAHDLLNAADSAMYEAKRLGGNNVRFSSDITQVKPPRPISTDHYYLVYQPVFSRHGQVVSQEGFLRSAYLDERSQTAAAIVPRLARMGRLNEVTEAVVREACSTYTNFERLRHTSYGTVSINITPEQLTNPRFSKVLSHIIRNYGLKAQDVELEIHLDEVSRHRLATHDRLDKLTRTGFSLILDEFSEEHLSLLRTLPIAGVKLSPQVQNNSLATERGRRYLTNLVSFCHSMDVWVGATRVETAAQLNELYEIGCDRFQGYLLGKPSCIPSTDVTMPIFPQPRNQATTA